ncbi:hypothetical protein HT594_00083 [Phenacoccus solenopsis nudivirus]|nr:hypothetical protein HT594_00083 [Phenacoccus solenopsis nudivirus]
MFVYNPIDHRNNVIRTMSNVDDRIPVISNDKFFDLLAAVALLDSRKILIITNTFYNVPHHRLFYFIRLNTYGRGESKKQ